jgi:hypothetical protein
MGATGRAGVVNSVVWPREDQSPEGSSKREKESPPRTGTAAWPGSQARRPRQRYVRLSFPSLLSGASQRCCLGQEATAPQRCWGPACPPWQAPPGPCADPVPTLLDTVHARPETMHGSFTLELHGCTANWLLRGFAGCSLSPAAGRRRRIHQGPGLLVVVRRRDGLRTPPVLSARCSAPGGPARQASCCKVQNYDVSSRGIVGLRPWSEREKLLRVARHSTSVPGLCGGQGQRDISRPGPRAQQRW